MPEFAFAFLDCEFGGLDPELHDITEIGVILTDYRLVESASSEWKVIGRPERITPEAAEMFGIFFEGHPNLVPLLLPEDMTDHHPLRKDNPLANFQSELEHLTLDDISPAEQKALDALPDDFTFKGRGLEERALP